MSDLLRLDIPVRLDHLPIATGFAENSALAFGLGSEEALALALATEEIIGELVGLASHLTIVARNGLYYAELDFTFPTTPLSLEKCNLTASTRMTTEADLDQIGWLVATRSVDGFQIQQLPGRVTRIRLRKNRDYPPSEVQTNVPMPRGQVVDIREPDEQELLLFARRALEQGVEPMYAARFSPPQRILDMVRSKEFEVLLGFSTTGDPLAGVLLDRTRSALAIMYGPIGFGQSPEVLRDLFHAVLNQLARTSVKGVVTESLHSVLPESEIEFLGSRRYCLPDGHSESARTSFRHLHDDEGFTVWSTPWLQDFLDGEYRRLALPREIHTWQPLTAGHDCPASVLSCEFRKRRSEAVLRPVLSGGDIEKNLRDHLHLIENEGYLNVTFIMDLGESFHLAFASALQAVGFRPAFLVPSAGKGDFLLFELSDDSHPHGSQ